ncbi:MAG: hypothetical protein TREMPRED_003984 [Tremellales sp. Tagirdzhanova-0007]|nr:MAG: hypothetical protein TREMPRED_003984 [Tremellales sp. Tagirdzhanova-0007]
MRKSKLPTLVPSLGAVIADDIRRNINAVSCHTMPTRVGHCIMLDEIATEARGARHHTSQGLAGLCRVHGESHAHKAKDFESIQWIANEVSVETTMHLGVKNHVAAATSFVDDAYFARPILISPSCKTETYEKHADLSRLLVREWDDHKDSEKKHGPIWSVAIRW